MDKLQRIFSGNEKEVIGGLDDENEVGFIYVDTEEGEFELQVSYEKLAEWYGIESYTTDVFEKSINYNSLDGLDKVGVAEVGINEQLAEELDENTVKELILEKVNDKDYSDLKLVK